MAEVYIRTDASSGVVTFVHRRPFDPVHGLGETRENLMKTGFFVSDFPEPITATGKKAVAYYDHERKKVYYEYKPAAYPERTRIGMLEDALNAALMTMGGKSIATANKIRSLYTGSDTESGDSDTMMNGLAKYLATQIYQGKLDRDAVINTYSDIKDDIEAYLTDMEVIPVIKAEEE